MADTPVETPLVDIPMDTPDAPATQAEEPKRQRGRPPGSKNKPKVIVVPLEPEAEPDPEPERELEPEPEPVQPKRARKPKVVEPAQPVYMKPPPLDHRMVMQYLASHLEEQKKSEREAKVDHYTRLISRGRWM